MIKNSPHKRSKIYVLITLFIFSTALVYSQKKNSIHVGIAESTYSNGKFPINFSSLYSKTDLHIGVQFDLDNSRLSTYGIYQFFGNFKEKNTPSFLFSSHLLGVGAEYRSNKDKRYALLLGFSAVTEVNTNFRNGYINNGFPSYPSDNHSDQFYHSTPLATSFYLGLEVLIVNNLNLSFSLENNIRLMKKRRLKWEASDFEDRPMDDVINEQPMETIIIDKIGLRLGLSFNFSIHRKENN